VLVVPAAYICIYHAKLCAVEQHTCAATMHHASQKHEQGISTTAAATVNCKQLNSRYISAEITGCTWSAPLSDHVQWMINTDAYLIVCALLKGRPAAHCAQHWPLLCCSVCSSVTMTCKQVLCQQKVALCCLLSVHCFSTTVYEHDQSTALLSLR
jgi:hypothetical protein